MLRLISLILNPVVTFGATLALSVLLSFASWSERFFWFILVFSICFMIPGIFYGELLIHGKIDADVKNKKRRAELLSVTAIAFAASYVISLFLSDASILSSVLLASVAINVVYSVALSFFKSEFSVHLGGLTLLVLFLGLHVSPWYYALGAPFVLLLAGSRYALRMHTLQELIGGFLTSVVVYEAVVVFL